ncbi:hypothetical protein RM705_36760, partial [Streptomyces sp. DSM 41636]|nr:hypothetical protein [Streptomyces sp. DSM 41636]
LPGRRRRADRAGILGCLRGHGTPATALFGSAADRDGTGPRRHPHGLPRTTRHGSPATVPPFHAHGRRRRRGPRPGDRRVTGTGPDGRTGSGSRAVVSHRPPWAARRGRAATVGPGGPRGRRGAGTGDR